jgi:Protein of unknown function (DUF669)
MKLNYRQTTDRPQRQRWGRTYEPFPPGVYKLRVLSIEPRAPKNGGADYLSATFEVEEGNHAGRKLWDQFHINHATSEAARDVSRDRLNDLAKSCGIFPIDDSDQLIDRVCVASVDIEEQDNYDPRNKIKWYRVPKEPHAQPYSPMNKAETPATPRTEDARGSASPRPRPAELDDDIGF